MSNTNFRIKEDYEYKLNSLVLVTFEILDPC